MQTSFLRDGLQLPLVIQPEGDNSLAALTGWLRARKHELEEHLKTYGGVLLRGFAIRSAEDFQQVAACVAQKFLPYTRGASPRLKVAGQVYTSTEAPAAVPIALHCELAYIDHYPDRICFFCHTPPAKGGETPIADMRAVYQALDPNVRRRFEERGLRLIQNVPAKKSLLNYRTWMEMFETDSREEVERACKNENLQFRWKPDGTLQLINTRPATLVHPVTGDKIWFNSMHNFHDSWSWEFRHVGRRGLALLAQLHERRHRRRLKPEDFPNHCTYGDGGEIPLEDVFHVRQVLWDHAVLFPWQQGDVTVLDNLRVAHGRMPFRGKRRILVTMGMAGEAAMSAAV